MLMFVVLMSVFSPKFHSLFYDTPGLQYKGGIPALTSRACPCSSKRASLMEVHPRGEHGAYS